MLFWYIKRCQKILLKVEQEGLGIVAWYPIRRFSGGTGKYAKLNHTVAISCLHTKYSNTIYLLHTPLTAFIEEKNRSCKDISDWMWKMALLGEIFIFKCQYFSVYSVQIDRLQSTIDRLWICANVSAANFRELSGNGEGVKQTFSSVESATRVHLQWRMSWPGHKHTHTWEVG